MREKLFRGKRKDNGEWIEGFLIIYDKRYFIITANEYETYFFAWLKDNEYIFGRFVEVIPETVGQYTGLTDKNGKKIFEGDIVSMFAWSNDLSQKGAKTTACIENYMGNSCICVYGGSLGVTLSSMLIDHTVEVIGNIHDTPELLKGGAE